MTPTDNQKARLENLLAKSMYRKIIEDNAIDAFCTVETSTGHGRWTAEWRIILDASFDERMSTPILLRAIQTVELVVTDPSGETWNHTTEFQSNVTTKLFELCN